MNNKHEYFYDNRQTLIYWLRFKHSSPVLSQPVQQYNLWRYWTAGYEVVDIRVNDL